MFSNYSTDAAINDARNSVNNADVSIKEANEAIRSTNKLLGEKGMFNPLDMTNPVQMGANIVKQVMGGGQQPNDDFDQKLTQEYQRARNTPGMEQYAKQIEGVAQFRSQGMGGAMQGRELANQAIGMEGQLRANQEYQMGQQQKALDWATNKARDVQRDTANQKFAQDVGMENLRQGYTQEQNVRQLKADQAKSLLDSYVQGRNQAMNFAQGAFRSLI